VPFRLLPTEFDRKGRIVGVSRKRR
jgi:hypothetical protein